MKNLKRTIAVFVFAVMVMAMLVGCGGSNTSAVAKAVREASATSQNKNLDSAASYLSNKELTPETIEAALLASGWTDVDIDDIDETEDGIFIVTTSKFNDDDSQIDIETIYFMTKTNYTSEQLEAWAGSELKTLVADLKSNFKDEVDEIIDPFIDLLEILLGYSIDITFDENSVDVAVAVSNTGTNEWLVVADFSCTAAITYTA